MNAGAFGNLSSGKTALFVKIILAEALKGRTVFSNIRLRFPRSCHVVNFILDDLPGMIRENPKQFEGSLLFIDEIPNIAEGRRATSTLNVEFTQFLTQLGKLGCDLYYTAQILTSQVDLRLREMGDLFYFCNRWFFNPLTGTWEPGVLKPRIIKLGDLVGKKGEGPVLPIAIQYIGFLRYMGGLQVKEFKGAYLPSPLDFALYDTKEVVLLDRSQFASSSRRYLM